MKFRKFTKEDGHSIYAMIEFLENQPYLILRPDGFRIRLVKEVQRAVSLDITVSYDFVIDHSVEIDEVQFKLATIEFN